MCPTEAIKLLMVEDDEMARLAAEDGLERYRDDLGAKPRVYYRNLHRWTTAFVALSVVFGDTDECGVGAVVSVAADGVEGGRTTADTYGDAVVDRLEPGREYSVTVSQDGYEAVTLMVRLDESKTLQPVVLQKVEAAVAGEH